MRGYLYQIGLLIKRLFLALGLFFIARLFFYFFNIGLYQDISLVELLWIFTVGIRFDVSVLVYFNLLFILPQVLPLGNWLMNKGFQLTLKILFVAVNMLILIVNLSDSVYFHFIQKRSTADVWKFIVMSDDVKVLLPGFIADYWYVSVLVVVFTLLVWKIYPKVNPKIWKKAREKDARRSTWFNIMVKSIAPFLLMGLALIGARGGLQLRPLAIMHASKSVSAANMPLVLNSVFTAMTTYGNDQVKPVHYMSDEQASGIYPVLHHFGEKGTPQPKNIVVLLLESFSREYVGFLNGYPGFTPFLDSLSQHALVMDSAFSNGLRSIDAIPAIVMGLPALMDDPFITSVYSTNKSRGLAQILNEKGYTTAFFHGGTNGTMDFDAFAGYAGFKGYYGRSEYNNDADYDDHWGIYDEPFLQYVAHTLNDFQPPFFAFEFTLSSHYPYHVPAQHQERFPEGDLRIHRVIRYADYALQKFFETAQTMPWYNNTLFVILADHPAQSVLVSDKDKIREPGATLTPDQLSYYKNTSGRYAIPMLLFAPRDSTLVGVDHRTIQQTDLAPTLLDYLNYQENMVAFGNSLFDTIAPRLVVHPVNGMMQITSGNYSLLFDGEQSTALFNNLSDHKHKNNLLTQQPALADSLEKQLKAFTQQYTQRLAENKLADTTRN
jgi:phosphoglycerol transferase MdoB-like AlkP superfamily enzyme